VVYATIAWVISSKRFAVGAVRVRRVRFRLGDEDGGEDGA